MLLCMVCLGFRKPRASLSAHYEQTHYLKAIWVLWYLTTLFLRRVLNGGEAGGVRVNEGGRGRLTRIVLGRWILSHLLTPRWVSCMPASMKTKQNLQIVSHVIVCTCRAVHRDNEPPEDES